MKRFTFTVPTTKNEVVETTKTTAKEVKAVAGKLFKLTGLYLNKLGDKLQEVNK